MTEPTTLIANSPISIPMKAVIIMAIIILGYCCITAAIHWIIPHFRHWRNTKFLFVLNIYQITCLPDTQ